MTSGSKTIAGFAIMAMLVGYQYYDAHSTKAAANERSGDIEIEIQKNREADASRIAELSTELAELQQHQGATSANTERLQKLAASARADQARAVAALKQTLEAHSQTMDSIRTESGEKIAEVRNETTNQIGAVTGEVGNVKSDLDTTKTDLGRTKDDLAASRREIGDVRDNLGRQIAHNADELSVLKRKGERNYYEFDIRKVKSMEKVAGIQIQLTKADAKAARYDLALQIEDNKVQKKGQLINEPVQFLVGKERTRYELVVNFIDKDRVRGYVSTPKEGVGEATAALLR